MPPGSTASLPAETETLSAVRLAVELMTVVFVLPWENVPAPVIVPETKELLKFGSTPRVTPLGTVTVVPVSVDRDASESEPSRLLALAVRCRFRPPSVVVPVVMIPVVVTSPPKPLKA